MKKIDFLILICSDILIQLCFGTMQIVKYESINKDAVIATVTVNTITSCTLKCEQTKQCSSVAIREMLDLKQCLLLRRECITTIKSNSCPTTDNAEKLMHIRKSNDHDDLKERNLALNKPTSQSSNLKENQYPARLANDGKTRTQSATGYNNGTKWWMVDMQSISVISRIHLVLNKNAKAQGKYKNMRIVTSYDNVNWELCKNLVSPESTDFIAKCERPTQGQFVRIEIHNSKNLWLREVMVYGC